VRIEARDDGFAGLGVDEERGNTIARYIAPTRGGKIASLVHRAEGELAVEADRITNHIPLGGVRSSKRISVTCFSIAFAKASDSIYKASAMDPAYFRK